MATVSISIRGRNYTVACEDGEEPRVHELAAALDAEVGGLGRVLGGLGESHLLVIAGLSLIDRINDLTAEADSATTQAKEVSGSSEARIAEIEKKAKLDRQAADAEIAVLNRALEGEKEKIAALEQEIAAAAEHIDAIAARVAEA